ncbi:MAG TPA: peptidylprolyl isomerase [Lacipirellulaceae bacterium]|jgi:cyclophilin family peptidyl-prolyl cis-trans isomerase|nr:peptidylprolyl isomerase [Lacipirellulaceae bacterium]
MSRLTDLTARSLVFAAIPLLSLPLQVARASQYVELDYNLTMAGRARNAVFLELFDDRVGTADNFLNYVNNTNVPHGSYSGSFMHRLARNFVIQGGGYYPNFVQEPAPLNVSLDPNAVIDQDGNPATPNPQILNQSGVAPPRSNTAGTIAMALINGQPNSASNQWFINLADNSSSLDSLGFTVFGQVAGDGMAMFNAFNSLSIANLNPDTNDDGVRDSGPFFNPNASLDSNNLPTDGVPYLSGTNQDILVVINQAKQIDYLGAGLTTDTTGGLVFSARDAYIDTGTQFTGTGPLTIGAGRTLGIREGISLGHDLSVHGTLAPGNQIGSITVQNYSQSFDGRLNIQIASATPSGQQYADTQYDRVNATGSAILAGELSIAFMPTYSPAANNSFTVLTAASIIGAFGTFDLPQLPLGDVWNISKTTTAFTLKIVYADFDHDGKVDTSDYILWRNSRNTTVTPGSGADADGNGFIDDADYAVWRANYGNVRGTESGSGSSLESGGVPEPGTCTLAGVLASTLIAVRRKRCV